MSQSHPIRPRPAARTAASHGLSVLAGLDSGRLLIFAAAGLSFLASVALFFTGSREQGIFVGLWVPSILSAGALLAGGTPRE
jgi:hypothetical protein